MSLGVTKLNLRFALILFVSFFATSQVLAAPPPQSPTTKGKAAPPPRPPMPKPGAKETPKPVATPPAPPVNEPTTLPTDPNVARRLEEGVGLIKDGEIDRGLVVIQSIFDAEESSYLKDQNHRWQLATRAAEETILEQPPTVLKRYRQLNDDEANHKLQQANNANDPELWAAVARRFFLTNAGRSAMDRLASYNLDLGRASLALFYFDRILTSPAHQESRLDSTRVKRTLAATILDRADEESKLPKTMTIKGRPESIAPWLKGFRKEWTEHDNTPKIAPTKEDVSDSSKRANWPLLAADWQWGMTRDPMITSMIDEIASASLPRQAPLLFGQQPVLVDGRIFFRDFDSTAALDPVTGERVAEYTNRTAITSEFKRPENRAYAMSPNPSGFECTFVANQVYGQLTTDGSRVYQIDDLPLNPNPYLPPFANQPGGDAGTDRSRNSIVALDAKTLEVRWRIGPANDKTTDGPTYFFGPPTPAQGKLYVIGERRSEIGLYCIQPETGEILWRQLLAVASRGIDSDIFRRSQACRVVDANGILLCPTNLFLLVAIDPVTRGRLWEYSLATEGQIPVQYTLGTQTIPPPAMINGTDAPLVTSNAVIVSEPLGQRIHCIDLETGKPRWQVPRDSDWYLGSAGSSILISIGSHQARGIRIGNGKVAWKAAIPVPSGRGIAIDSDYLLPTTDGRLLVIDMGSGRIMRELSSRDRLPLGTVIAEGDKIFTISSSGLQSFPRMGGVQKEVDRLLAGNPQETAGLYRRALIHLTVGAIADTIDDLQGAAVGDPNIVEVKQSRTLLFDLASHEALTQATIPEALVNNLATFATTDTERGIYLRLKAEYLIRLGQVADIASILDEHAKLRLESNVPSEWNFVERTPRTWMRAFLRKTLVRLDTKAQASLLEVYRERLRAAKEASDLDVMRSLAFLLAGQPLGDEVRLALADALIAKDEPAEAEINLLQAAAGSDPATVVAALDKLVELAKLTERPQDQDYFLEQLSTKVSASELPKEEKADLIARFTTLRKQLPPDAVVPVSLPWKSTKIESSAERSFRPEPSRRIAFAAQSALPFFRPWVIVLDQQRWELDFLGRQSGLLDWKLQQLPASLAYQQPLTFQQIGSMLVFEQSDSVYAVSGLEKRLLWNRSFEDRSSEVTEVVSTSGRVRKVRASSATYLSGQMLWPKIVGSGPNYLVVRAGKMLSLLDPWTHEILWSRSDLNQDQFITADGEYVLIISPAGKWSAHRTLDGELTSTGEVGPDIRFMNGTNGRRLLLFQTDSTAGQRRILRLYDPIIKTHVWKQVFPPNTEWKMVDDQRIVLFDDKRNLTILRIDTGEILIREQLEANEVKESIGPTMLHAFSDGERLFVGSNQNFSHENIYPVSPSNNVRMQTVHGWLRAYDLKTKRKLWHRELYNRNLLIGPGEDLPYLVAIGNRLVDIGDEQRRPATTVDLLDKGTGEVIATRDHDQYGTMVELAYSIRDQWIEVRGNNLRIRFEFLRDGQPAKPVPSVENSATSPMMRRFFERAQRAREKRDKEKPAAPAAKNES